MTGAPYTVAIPVPSRSMLMQRPFFGSTQSYLGFFRVLSSLYASDFLPPRLSVKDSGPRHFPFSLYAICRSITSFGFINSARLRFDLLSDSASFGSCLSHNQSLPLPSASLPQPVIFFSGPTFV